MSSKKECQSCLEIKPVLDYYTRSLDGKFYKYCLLCCQFFEEKQCVECEIVKNYNKFYCTKIGLQNRCKECEKSRKRLDYKNNREYIRKQQKEYYDQNKEDILEHKKEYYEDNKDIIIEKFKKRYNEDPKFKLYTCIRRRTRDFLRGSSNYGNIIGCSYNKIISWFEFNFELDSHIGMNWDNLGEVWQIDHVYALSKLYLIPKSEHHKYYSWRNLRPVDKKYNLIKSNNIKQMDLLLLEIRIKLFEKQYISSEDDIQNDIPDI